MIGSEAGSRFVERKKRTIFKDMDAFKKHGIPIKTQNRWAIKDMKIDDTRKLKSCRVLDSEKEEKIRETFDAKTFKPRVTPTFSLTKTARQHLMKPRYKRTPTDLKVFAGIIDKLKLFATYPQKVRDGLAKIAYYEAFEEDKVIVRQGDVGFSLYFILNGEVLVEVAENDKKHGQNRKQTVAEMFAGDMFGEVSLLHNIQRTATIICKERSEFLRIDKPDFDMVLKTSYEEEWESRVNYLKSLPEFKSFTSKELQHAVAASKVDEYPEDTVVLRGNIKDGEFVYFIKSGQCRVVREMKLVTRNLPFGASQLLLPPEETQERISFQMTKHDTTKKYYLVIRVLEVGDFFGVGEHSNQISVVTSSKAEIVRVPRVVLARANRGIVLTEMLEYQDQAIPSTNKIFRSFLEEIKWKAYRRQIILEILEKRKSKKNITKFNDVPLSIRNAHPDYMTHYGNAKLPMIPLRA